MKRLAAGALVIFASLVVAPLANADYVVSLRDGRRIRATFVRVEGTALRLSQPSGELVIEQTAIASVEEVEPEPPVAAAVAADGAPAPTAPPVSAFAVTAQTQEERERAAARRVILGHRDLLFARLRGDSAEAIEKRKKELERWTNQRLELREQRPSWEQAGPGQP